MKDIFEKVVIDKATASAEISRIVSQADDAIRIVGIIISECNVPFTLSWYKEHGKSRQALERWYCDGLEKMIKDSGVTTLSEDGRLQIEATRTLFSQQFAKVEDYLKKIRGTLENEIINFTDGKNGITYAKDELRTLIEKRNSFSIDTSEATKYYSLFENLKRAQKQLVEYEKQRGIVPIGEGGSFVVYPQFGGVIASKFSLHTLMDDNFTPEKFLNLFANYFKVKDDEKSSR